VFELLLRANLRGSQRPRVRPSPVSELSALWHWSESYCRPDESCADPADILVNIAVLKTSLLIKRLMSQTQSERIGNDQQSQLIQRNLEGDLRAHPTQYAGGRRDHGRDLPGKHFEAGGIAFTRAAGPIKGVLQESSIAAVVLGGGDQQRMMLCNQRFERTRAFGKSMFSFLIAVTAVRLSKRCLPIKE
jgi:hypothetical protein